MQVGSTSFDATSTVIPVSCEPMQPMPYTDCCSRVASVMALRLPEVLRMLLSR